jgi:hypothetical protein
MYISGTTPSAIFRSYTLAEATVKEGYTMGCRGSKKKKK